MEAGITHKIFSVEYDGPEQCRRPVLFRLCDGSVLTIDTAIAMVRYHSARFLERTDWGWKNLTVIHTNLGVFGFDI